MPTPGLTFAEFEQQMEECQVLVMEYPKTVQSIIIRTPTGDHALAACWRKDDTLYFDLGGKIDGAL